MDLVTDSHSGVQFCVPVGTGLLERIRHEGVPDSGLIRWCEQYLTPGGTFIDVGAQIGAFPILLHKKCRNVVAFEAHPVLSNCLAVGIGLNNALAIKIYRVALSSKPGSARLLRVENNIFRTTLVKDLTPEVETAGSSSESSGDLVQTQTLDSFKLTSVDFLRINSPGRNLEVLKGASLTLVDNNFPPFIFEIPESEARAPLFNFIEGLGYKLYPVGGCVNIYLASDHPLRPKKVTPKEPELPPKFDLTELISAYESGQPNLMNEIKSEDHWEAWHALARHYRIAGQYSQAYECAHKSWESNPPPTKEYLIHEEISIVAYYLNKHAEGYNACEQIVLSQAPWETRNSTINNQGFYMERLPLSRSLNLLYDLPPGFIASSTAIVSRKSSEETDGKEADGEEADGEEADVCYEINLRSVNYTINTQGGYIIRDPDGIVRTRNFILKLADDFKIIGPGVELIDRSGVPLYPKNILGLEDIRLFGERQFFCTYLEVNEARIPQICYGRYDDAGNVIELHPLMVGTKLQCEKNWLPFLHNGVIHFIYSFAPFRLYRLEMTTPGAESHNCSTEINAPEVQNKTMAPVLVKETYLSDFNIGDFRGSACPIRYKDGWLFTIHQVYYADPRKYFHRLAWADLEFTTLKYSRLFYFEIRDIEYNLAICESPSGLVLTYSLRDNCSKIGILPYDIVDRMLFQTS